MIKLDIKPLSINEAFQGRRFKTKKYLQFEKNLLYLLPKKSVSSKALGVYLEFGVSALSDIDNGIKPTLDVLQKKYGFNDRYIFELNVKKLIVKKGFEYIKFDILEL